MSVCAYMRVLGLGKASKKTTRALGRAMAGGMRGGLGERGYFPQDWSSLPAGTPSGGRVGLRLELAWLDRAETPC